MRSINEQECSQEQPLVSFIASRKAVIRFQMTPLHFNLENLGIKICSCSAIIKPLSVAERLPLLTLIARDLSSHSSQQYEAKEHSIMELEGLDADLLAKMNAQVYINSLRAEWD
jgi:hypothetical protein